MNDPPVSELYQVLGPGFCAGYVVDGKKVTGSAPILASTVLGWPPGKALERCQRKGWQVRLVNQNWVRKMTDNYLEVKLLRSTSLFPTRGSPAAAGLDLYADFGAPEAERIIAVGCKVMIPTGIAATAPMGCYLRIAPRSGLAVKPKYTLDVLAGVVDRDYTGEIMVCLINHGPHNYTVKQGDRVAQMIPEVYNSRTILVQVEDLTCTERGSAGFGSTGA